MSVFVDGGLGKRSFLRIHTNKTFNRSEISFSEFVGYCWQYLYIVRLLNSRDGKFNYDKSKPPGVSADLID
ncbi:Leucine--tRNA ligase [Dirofilaria immitis]